MLIKGLMTTKSALKLDLLINYMLSVLTYGNFFLAFLVWSTRMVYKYCSELGDGAACLRPYKLILFHGGILGVELLAIVPSSHSTYCAI